MKARTKWKEERRRGPAGKIMLCCWKNDGRSQKEIEKRESEEEDEDDKEIKKFN